RDTLIERALHLRDDGRILSHALMRLAALARAADLDMGKSALPLAVHVGDVRRRLEEIGHARGVVADVVEQPEVARGWRAARIGQEPGRVSGRVGAGMILRAVASVLALVAVAVL